jgi:Xaa-Pro aminopeptidase
MINQKILQASEILKEQGVDLWLTFTRETSSTPDPILDLILGANCVWPSAFLITAKGEATAIVGSLDAQNVKDHADAYHVVSYVGGIQDELLKALRRIDPKRIAVNYSENDTASDGLTHGMYLTLTRYLSETPYADRLESSEPVISSLRGRKSPAEVERIRAAVDETLRIFDDVTGFMRSGISEKEVADFILMTMKSRGLESAWEEDQCPAVFTGPESAGAHAGPTGRKIEPGHLVNIDFGVKKNGYCADLQRTWYVLRDGESKPPADVMKGFTTIVESIQKAAAILKPGVEGWLVDAEARCWIVNAGYDEFKHALGHQIGRRAHDGAGVLCPKWERYGKLPYSKVEAGQVYTIEPRLYVKDRGVATIEEIVVVEENGCCFISKPQKEIYLIR